MNVDAVLSDLEAAGNLRVIPAEPGAGVTDFTSNDYLGFGSDISLRERFFGLHNPAALAMTSSASRLLAGSQKTYTALEESIARSYNDINPTGPRRRALIFNSGYHANTGIIPTIADRHTTILADRLVHASAIDGIRLSGARFSRFSHNDFDHLERLVQKARAESPDDILIIVESVYSMDGDRADIERLVEIKKSFPRIMLYVDEAHAVGVSGPGGLGETAAHGLTSDIDFIVGTFGKALASAGAFAVTSESLRRFLVNKARSFIFSTALPPAQMLWTRFIWHHALEAESARDALQKNAALLAEIIPGAEPSHIRPLIVGDAHRAVALSKNLLKSGFNALPIRTPTVPPGSERLRFSLSAAVDPAEIRRLGTVLKSLNAFS